MKTAFRVLALTLLCVSASWVAAGQDLGTSNKVFRSLSSGPIPAKPPTGPKKVNSRNRGNKPFFRAKREKAQSGSSSSQASRRPLPKTSQIPIKTTSKPNPALIGEYENLLARANADAAARNYAAAENGYLRASRLNVDDQRVLNALADLYVNTERWEAAERIYRTAIQRKPNDQAAYIGLSYVLSQPVITAGISDRYDESEKMARMAIGLQDGNVAAFDQLGMVLERKGLIDGEAERVYRRSIELDPGYARAYAHLGGLLLRRGLNNRAEIEFSTARTRAKSASSMIAVAETFMSVQRFRDSIALLERLLRNDPKNVRALLMIGRAMIADGRSSEAERYLRSSIAVSPNSFAGYSLLGELFLRQQKYDDAVRLFTQASKFAGGLDAPLLAGQLEAVGDVFLKLGKRAEAVLEFKKALALDPTRHRIEKKLRTSSH